MANIHRYSAKSGLVILGLVSACGYSLWQKMQWPATLSMVLVVAILYKRHSLRLVESFFSLIEGSRVSKLGQVEFQPDPERFGVTEMTVTEMMLADLTPRDVSVLMTVYYADRFHPRSDDVRQRLRKLRDKGWLEHDKRTLSESGEVWLTAAGKSVATALSLPSAVASNQTPVVERQSHAAAGQ